MNNIVRYQNREFYKGKEIAHNPTPFLGEIWHVILLNDLGLQELARMARSCSSWNKFFLDHFFKDIYQRDVNTEKELRNVLTYLSVVMSSTPYNASTKDSQIIQHNMNLVVKAKYCFLALIRYTTWSRATLCKVISTYGLAEQNACFLLVNENSYLQDSIEAKNLSLFRRMIKAPLDMQAYLSTLYTCGLFEASIQLDVILLNYLILLRNLPENSQVLDLLEHITADLFAHKAKNFPTEIHPHVIRLVLKKFLLKQQFQNSPCSSFKQALK